MNNVFVLKLLMLGQTIPDMRCLANERTRMLWTLNAMNTDKYDDSVNLTRYEVITQWASIQSRRLPKLLAQTIQLRYCCCFRGISCEELSSYTSTSHKTMAGSNLAVCNHIRLHKSFLYEYRNQLKSIRSSRQCKNVFGQRTSIQIASTYTTLKSYSIVGPLKSAHPKSSTWFTPQ